MLLRLATVVAVNRFELNISTTDVLYFGSGTTGFARAESFVLLPLIFTLVAAAFIPLARSLGLLFTQTAPLTAYTFDILGSLAGTAAFFLISYFALPPIFGLLFWALLVLVLSSRGRFPAQWRFDISRRPRSRCFLQRDTYWSPYYKITLTPAKPAAIISTSTASGIRA